MSRSNQQLIRLVQQLSQGVQSGKIKLRWIVLIGLFAVGYLLLQPLLQEKLGVDLPGLDDVVADSSPAPSKSPSRETKGSKHESESAAAEDASELQQILRTDSRRTYTSPAGLSYTGGSLQGHRIRHLMTHARDQPDRQGQHGVFDHDDVTEIVALVDEAYLQALTGRDTRTQREEERIVYDVNLRRRIGYIGGTSGKRRDHPPATHLRLVIDGDRLITAFPVIP